MPGVPDPLYVRARAALLDAVEALEAHLGAIVLVGAQAIYLHTGDANLAVAEYTTDADFTISPRELADAPLLGELLGAAGFTAATTQAGGSAATASTSTSWCPRRSPARAHAALGWARMASEQRVARKGSKVRSSIVTVARLPRSIPRIPER